MKAFLANWWYYGIFDPRSLRPNSFTTALHHWFWYPQYLLMGVIRRKGYMKTEPACILRWRDLTIHKYPY